MSGCSVGAEVDAGAARAPGRPGRGARNRASGLRWSSPETTRSRTPRAGTARTRSGSCARAAGTAPSTSPGSPGSVRSRPRWPPGRARFGGADHGHDLERMAGWAWPWTAAVAGDTRLHHAVGDLAGSALAHRHPDRRYWARGWSRADAERAVGLAGRLVAEHVIADLLDRGDPWGAD